MIQPVDINGEGRGKPYRVHDMMLDLTVLLSREKKSVIIFSPTAKQKYLLHLLSGTYANKVLVTVSWHTNRHESTVYS
jgi:hypothetical protein